jgi:hypothetical protein
LKNGKKLEGTPLAFGTNPLKAMAQQIFQSEAPSSKKSRQFVRRSWSRFYETVAAKNYK